jgi:hypothetical protein
MITFGVFFPALMGAGILVSGVILLSDVMRRLMPNRGQRRRYRVAMGTFGVIARTAATVGVRIDPPEFLTRVLRTRSAYAVTAALCVGIGSAALWTGIDAFEDAHGVFYRSPWAIGLGVVIFVAFGLTAAMALTLTVVRSSRSAAVTWVVEHSPYGRISVPQRVAVDPGIGKDRS